MQSKQALFEQYPLDGQVTVAGELLTTPCHVYDGTMLFFGGTADASTATDLLSREHLTPVFDESGQALAAVWVCDFSDANLGPHHELQISLFAASHATPPLKVHPFAVFHALVNTPEIWMVCHGLWNSTERVVRYNSDHLGLTAAHCSSEIKRSDGYWSFRFADTTGSMIAAGNVRAGLGQSASTMWQLARHLGIKGMLRSIRSPFVHLPVVNTRSRSVSQNLIADTYSRSDRQTLRSFGPQDSLMIGHPAYARLGFRPDFVQENEGTSLVFLRPRPLRTPMLQGGG